MPGPTSVLDGDFATPTDVIEQSLLVGFVGRKEQTGHPSQKPIKVYDPMMQMSMSDGGLILDPLCGSGTVGVVSKNRGFRSILCDGSDEYTELTEKRLGIKRLSIKNEINQLIDGSITR
jgi:site-specific DNA-methyltransferase (adenine-specific)